jgi:hypothetical protein
LIIEQAISAEDKVWALWDKDSAVSVRILNKRDAVKANLL